MVQVTELGYIGFGVKDLSAWKKFATNILAMEVVDDRDRCYLRMDYQHHRIVLHSDPSDDLMYMGFRVAGPGEFRAMQSQLREAGVAFRVGSEEEAGERQVLEVMKLHDPDGNPVEIFHGPHVQFSKPFHSGRGMHGRFKTGSGGLGHCIIREKDPEAAWRFYTQLGMRGGVEYKVRAGDHTIAPIFMHCNERDHTVAFGVPNAARRFNHLMIEVDNLDDVGLTHEIVRREKIPVHITLGKHSNDHMFSFYFETPSGWMLEYGWGARNATYQSEYYSEDLYGHAPEAGGFGPPPKGSR
jgi:2,3-dihydroxyethylbenzene 1,2-dioxygenase